MLLRFLTSAGEVSGLSEQIQMANAYRAGDPDNAPRAAPHLVGVMHLLLLGRMAAEVFIAKLRVQQRLSETPVGAKAGDGSESEMNSTTTRLWRMSRLLFPSQTFSSVSRR